MIRLIDIRLNAAHPELPLCEAVTYTGAPSTVLIRGVPPNCGRWAITAVFVAASFPDGSTTTRAAVQSANGVWVATLPATATSGRTANGIRIMADGIDENGEAVTGYILGVADFAVASLAVTPAPEPGGIAYALRYFDTLPDPAKKGDVTRIDGVLKFYDGAAWEPFTDLSDYYTSEQVDEAIDKLAAYYITADAQGNPFATHAALVNAQTYYSGGAARTPTRNDYAIVLADETHGGAEYRYIYAVDAQGAGQWEPQYAVEGVVAYDNTVTRTSANGVKSSGIWAALWGALASLPTGFTSLYDWCVSRLNGKADKVAYANDGNLAALDANGNLKDSNNTVQGTFGCGELVVGYSLDQPNQRYADIIAQGAVADHCTIVVYNSDSLGHYHYIALPNSYGTDKESIFALEREIAPAFDDTATYAEGALVYYNDALYRCITAVTSAGAWTGSTNWTAASVEDVLAALRTALAGKADAADLRYSLTTKTIAGGAVTLDDRAINAVAVSSSLASLTVNFPAATSGKARDFGLRLTVASGITTAPQLVLPQGVTCENADGAAPEIGADGAATILYFTETAAGVFLVKGEVVQTIS